MVACLGQNYKPANLYYLPVLARNEIKNLKITKSAIFLKSTQKCRKIEGHNYKILALAIKNRKRCNKSVGNPWQGLTLQE